MNINKCNKCGNDIKGSSYSVSGEIFCGTCYNLSMCQYCDPPVLAVNCRGHRFSPTTTNRFMADKEFVEGTRMEIES
jgi:hypothetical protein